MPELFFLLKCSSVLIVHFLKKLDSV